MHDQLDRFSHAASLITSGAALLSELAELATPLLAAFPLLAGQLAAVRPLHADVQDLGWPLASPESQQVEALVVQILNTFSDEVLQDEQIKSYLLALGTGIVGEREGIQRPAVPLVLELMQGIKEMAEKPARHLPSPFVTVSLCGLLNRPNLIQAVEQALAQGQELLRQRLLLESLRQKPREKENLRDQSANLVYTHDCRTVIWRGIQFNFTKTQAPVVKELISAHHKGGLAVGSKELLEAAGSECKRFRDVFKIQGGMHPAWMTMIMKGATAGCYRIEDPES